MTKNLTQISTYFKEKPHRILLILGVAFFFIYAWQYASTPSIYNSPDETANAVFIQHFIEETNFKIPFAENPHNLLHPRSVNIIDSNFVPGGFLGLLLLYGFLGKLLGGSFIFLPGLVAVIGVFSYYGITRRIFSEKIALLSTIFLFFLPQWWHYAAKGLLPNISFLSFLLLGGYLWLKGMELLNEKNKLWLLSILGSGLGVGIALSIRPNEVIWVGLSAIILLIIYRKKISYQAVIIFLIGMSIIGGLTLFWNNTTFGSPLSTGYEQYQLAGGGDEQVSQSNPLYRLFPFGIDIAGSLVNFAKFGLQLFWWQFIFIIAGLIAFFQQKEKKSEQRLYTIFFLGISLYLIFYYGSWVIADDLDTSRVSIGISYIRYWLLIFVGALPFFLLGLFRLLRRLPTSWRNIAQGLLFAALLFGHVYFVYGAKDNFVSMRGNIVNYNETRQEVISLTESNSVIVSERNDKVFWPDRQVIHYQDQDFSFAPKLVDLLSVYPVYWYSILPDSHISIWEQKVFSDLGIEVQRVDSSLQAGNLYQFKLLP